MTAEAEQRPHPMVEAQIKYHLANGDYAVAAELHKQARLDVIAAAEHRPNPEVEAQIKYLLALEDYAGVAGLQKLARLRSTAEAEQRRDPHIEAPIKELLALADYAGAASLQNQARLGVTAEAAATESRGRGADQISPCPGGLRWRIGIAETGAPGRDRRGRAATESQIEAQIKDLLAREDDAGAAGLQKRAHLGVTAEAEQRPNPEVAAQIKYLRAREDYAFAAALQKQTRREAAAQAEQRVKSSIEAQIKDLLAKEDYAGAATLQQQTQPGVVSGRPSSGRLGSLKCRPCASSLERNTLMQWCCRSRWKRRPRHGWQMGGGRSRKHQGVGRTAGLFWRTCY
ncbi:hypothetical protein N9L19_00170 [bacterium]|nr:hypothetical protein [bacterium]MDA8609307.1 hypothetical protein [bacterium]